MKMALIAPLAIAGMAFFAFAGGQIVRLLWNWLMPSIFGLRQLTFWEALGLLFLCRILFGGISGRGLAGSRASRRTEESRERFRQRIRERFKHFAADDEPAETAAPR